MTDVNAHGGGSVKGALSRVRGSCKGKSMHMIRLRREFGFNSDMSASVRLRLMVKMCLHVGSNVEGAVTSPGLGTRVRLRCSVRFRGT